MLKVVYGNDLQSLAIRMTADQQASPLSPFEPETVIVQSNELARWLSFYQASQQGIAAHIDYPFPSAYLWRLFRDTWPTIPTQSGYAKEPLTWRLFELIPACRQLPGFESVNAYLGEADDPLRLYELASRLADTFDQYLMYRPDWIKEWEQGNTPHWQGQLWHRLTETDPEPLHRARLLEQFYQLLQQGALPAEALPKRLSVFGLSAMPPVYLQLFEALAKHTKVTLYYLSPSEQFWGDLITPKQFTKQQLQFEFEADSIVETHPLLASLGKQGQAFFQQLQEIEHQADMVFEAPQANTLLGCLQADLFHLADIDDKTSVDAEDHSIQLHVCHSAMREIEVLHDQLLHLFEQQPAISPVDIVVMTPDIDVYAPWIEAVFSTAPEHQKIPFSIADSQTQSESVLLQSWSTLMTLPQSRFDVETVLALIESPAVQQRFQLDDTALQWCRLWCQQTRIRWGLDGQAKTAFDLPENNANTWQAGLDRLMLGYAMPLTEADHPWRLFDEQLAFDGISGDRAFYAANLARFLEQLGNWRQRLTQSLSLAEWQPLLIQCLESFFAIDEIEARQSVQECQQIREQLTRLAEYAEQAQFDQPVAIEIVASWLNSHLEPVDNSHRFLGHGVTFCGMVPMRSIPFDVICLIGMNDDVFPRSQPSLGFDLLSQHHRRGDRSRRDDDRYLFLEALISARRQLYLSYVGASIVDNAPIPPSVLISDLTDYLDENFASVSHETVSAQITVKHPLQAFSRRYFDGQDPALFSYQASQCPTELAVSQTQNWFEQPLPEADENWRTLTLLQLSQFFQHPARFLCRERLGVRLELDEDELETREPFSLNGLEAWQMRQLLLDNRLRQQPLEDSAQLIRATGMLPQGLMGEHWFEQEAEKVNDFIDKLEPALAANWLPSQNFEYELAGFSLSGQFDKISEHGLLRYRMSKTKARDLMAGWLDHLLLNLLKPVNVSHQTTLIMEDQTLVFTPFDGAEAALADLLALYWQGLQQPLPFFAATSLAYATSALGEKPEQALSQAEKSWQGNDYVSGEKDDAYHQLIYSQPPLDERFMTIAMQVFQPLFEHCQILDGAEA